MYPKRHNICSPTLGRYAMSDPTDAVEEVENRVRTTDSVDIDTLTADVIEKYSNQWDLPRCFQVIDDSERVSAVNIGEQQSVGELSPAGGDTTLEKETRYWTGVALVERGLDAVDADTVRVTVGV